MTADFIVENWAVFVAALAILAVAIVAIVRFVGLPTASQLAKVKEWLLWAVTEATITLDEPLAVEGDITVAILAVTGDIPVDAEYTVEVTNNAKDSSPVWQDATTEVKNGTNIVFENHANTNGAAFNFRITVKRGSSNTGGHISGVSGAFQ